MSDTVTTVDFWAILELMGRQRLAGRVTEQTVGGAGFIHVAVPESDGQPGFSRLLSPAAIYAINPCTEQLARAAAGRMRTAPIQAYEIRGLLASESTETVPGPTVTIGDDDIGDEEDDGYSHVDEDDDD